MSSSHDPHSHQGERIWSFPSNTLSSRAKILESFYKKIVPVYWCDATLMPFPNSVPNAADYATPFPKPFTSWTGTILLLLWRNTILSMMIKILWGLDFGDTPRTLHGHENSITMSLPQAVLFTFLITVHTTIHHTLRRTYVLEGKNGIQIDQQ
jgi:hypothetical protein